MDAKIRLYVEHPLGEGQSVPLDRAQAHYLFGVMRQTVGAQVLLFNGRDGEWLAEVAEAGKRGGTLTCAALTKPLQMPPDLWLCFAPIKKARTDFIVEKATEMGAARIVPMQTEYTNSGRIQRDRLQAHATEAAEQCGGTFVPMLTEYTNSGRIQRDRLQAHATEAAEQCGGTFAPEVADMVRFDRLLQGWDAQRRIMFCDEALVRAPAAPLAPGSGGPWAIFIGPEGGFSERERTRLQALDHAQSVSLGPRILRADTAAVAAMTVWQQTHGDWA